MTLAGRYPEQHPPLWLRVVRTWERDEPEKFRRWQELARGFAAKGEERKEAGRKAWKAVCES